MRDNPYLDFVHHIESPTLFYVVFKKNGSAIGPYIHFDHAADKFEEKKRDHRVAIVSVTATLHYPEIEETHE